MGVFNEISFVRDEIKDLPGIKRKPPGGIGSFTSRIGHALSLGFKEKEIFVFGLLQWAAIGLGYLLWVQMLDWIPESVWRSAAESDSGSIADLVLWLWSFVCVGVVAYPIGILSGCMGAAHFLHRQGQPSSIAACLQMVMPQSWPLWSFHWIDGWITVKRILDRLPKKDDKRTTAQKAAAEALYYAWKLGTAGVLPNLVTGHGLIRSGKNSVLFVKDNFKEVAKLRTGYSALCWVVGILAYIGTLFLFMSVDIVPEGGEIYGHVYTFYLWAAVPILVATAVIMLLLRPIYILALCELYSEYVDREEIPVDLPDNPAKGTSALVAFACLCLILGVVYLFRQELGISDMLATPYGE
ncbi:hypothetical protein [Marinicella meishanensis]|uniref:hypothetical protein n=1 Tax=Marinicella meishanensis TaxID=2873263 RepID=UPI001CBEB91F|nr:hypothetical protein [Marinicella sp. NBU2979]